jgi:site-specific DNA-methyltransferase (adenine-specific)
MATLDAESIDAIVTDPPYGLGFMGKAWDDPSRLASVPPSAVRLAESGRDPYPKTGKGPAAVAFDGRAFQSWCSDWATAAYRVAKPSAYLLAFGGTRTVHRMTVALEDAGWIIRDMLVWAYASGFPKSKASLKPAWEPIVMARKPGPLRMLAIDECRIGPPLTPEEVARSGGEMGVTDGRGVYGPGKRRPAGATRQGEPSADRRYTERGGVDIAALPGPRGGDALGRWPANIVLTDPIFDGGWDGVVGGGETAPGAFGLRARAGDTWGAGIPTSGAVTKVDKIGGYDDSGTYSRFFLIPKAARSDREPAMGGLPVRFAPTMGNGIGGREHDPADTKAYRRNHHPTVKPLDLMRHLVRLVTPTGGTVLDPFLGSGTTALAAEMEGFGWVGIEKEAEYVAIAEARLNGVQRGMGLVG